MRSGAEEIMGQLMYGIMRVYEFIIGKFQKQPRGKSQFTVSPRAQFALKPDWEADMVFRISGGLYHQPPFYRELRDAAGQVQPNIKAQQSIHFVLGNDYSFKMWDRPFKLVSELYYKSLSDVNTYTIDNVRIRYAASNVAKACTRT
jgi:hypothetical protein